jgi:rsbT antagonist protein RsbS
MDRIPLLKIGDFLLVTVQVDMHDRLAVALQDDLTDRIVTSRAKGVLIDISALDIVDSFIGRMLGNIAGMARILDAALNIDRGMDLLRAASEETGARLSDDGGE